MSPRIPQSEIQALTMARERDRDAGTRFAAYLMLCTMRRDLYNKLQKEILPIFHSWLEVNTRMENRQIGINNGANAYRQISSICPNGESVEIHYVYGIWLEKNKYIKAAVRHQRKALMIDSTYLPSRNALLRCAGKLCDSWHILMINDAGRNHAFVNALKSILVEKSKEKSNSVLDLGSGTGLLGIAAAKLDASEVKCIECDQPLADLSFEIANNNEAKVNVESRLSTSIDKLALSSQFDILISEIFDCGLLGESAIDSILHAKENLLKPEHSVIPARARLYCQEYYSFEIKKKSFALFGDEADRPDRIVAAPFMARKKPKSPNKWEPYEGEKIHMLKGYDPALLGERQLMMEIDFNDVDCLRKHRARGSEVQRLNVNFANKKKQMNAIVVTFELDLTEDRKIQISNSVDSSGCWEQAVYPIYGECEQPLQALFRLEHDAAILEKIGDEPDDTPFWVHSRLVYEFNSDLRRQHVFKLFDDNKKILILHSNKREYDILYGAMQTKTELIICSTKSDTVQAMERFSMDKSGIKAQNVNVAKSLSAAQKLLPKDTSLSMIKLCIPFMNVNSHVDWEKLQSYLSGELFSGVDDLLRKELDKPVNVNFFFQLVKSAEIEKRAIASDANLPLGMKMENAINTFQMTSYPLYPEVDWDKYLEPRSEVINRVFTLDSQSITKRGVQFRNQCELRPGDITGVVWWAEIERDGWKERTAREIYLTKGFREDKKETDQPDPLKRMCEGSSGMILERPKGDSQPKNEEVSITVKFLVNSLPHLSDNGGVTFDW